MVKNLPATRETQIRSLGQEDPDSIPGEGDGNSLQYSCLENPTVRGYSPWGRKGSDTTELLTQLQTIR